TNQSAVIVDQTYSPPTSSVTAGPIGPPHPVATPGQKIALANPTTGANTTVVVLGVLSESFVNGVFVNPTTASALGYHTASTYFLTAHPGVSTVAAARAIKAAFFPYGLVLFDFRALLSSSLSSTEGVIGLLQIFVGLGLGVGIAGMGIVALRAVVERRREIGMLRASGFTQGMILRAFLLEYSFVALLGIAIGTALGLLIVYDLVLSPSASSVGVSIFAPPWFNLALILLVTYALAMAAVAGPSWRAARLPPADAVRTTE
ncbi:MAG: FtsX-like permease family protein, partial [Thermoplasmata archaeon]|nr:FtsX-like permease family protein [Thermoplasmata archaeon]